ncbi:UDP-N-acetylmuramate dehydrogenase [Puia dinghuensis]|uniref:UDP-N-acetylenolpyruvoylglucosamine reductase n=1 Tax=Puia dinghuensis TaxID=1792502 RepID=A0A8J2U664_9BACT|nr:UDP-N-acetylmuramate dehydrogenase [Puia dinghuensis]GGA81298.1 UDP-N-acetylenolpyruvoylglucosamine reductase [Puia dinghuensis]
MQLLAEEQSLKRYNTFGIDVKARWLASFGSSDELGELVDWAAGRRLLVLGGGSNVLFTEDIDGLVLRNAVKGIELLHEDEEYVYVRAGAGESWDGFVQYCIARDWAGVENLSLIPGNVGAAPMQNIGAYGVEIRDVFWELEAWSLAERKVYTFTPGDCEFGYRESVFKGRLKGQFVILNVVLRLSKDPVFHTSYGAIREELGDREPSIRAISEAVIRIRRSKLPDPAEIGNAGSFFKNPTVPGEVFARLKERFPEMVGYPGLNGEVKVAAGWLIEKCGWKGFRRGDAGVHARQALVLVNYGQAKGKDIYALSEEILHSVQDLFGIVLEREVNIIN